MGNLRIKILDKAIELEKNIVDKDAFVTPEAIMKSRIAEDVSGRIITEVIKNYVKAAGYEGAMKNLKDLNINPEEFKKAFADVIQRTNDLTIKDQGLKDLINAKATPEEIISKGIEVLSKNENANDKLLSVFGSTVKEQSKLKTVKALDGIIDQMAVSIGVDVDSLMPNEDVFINEFDNPEKFDVKLMEPEINALKEENKTDLEFVKTLEKAQSYLVTGISNDDYSMAVEAMGRMSADLQHIDGIEYMKKSDLGYDTDAFVFAYDAFEYDKKMDKVRIAKNTKLAVENYPKIEQDTKKGILDLANYIKSQGIEGYDMKQIGAMDPLMDAKKNLQNAVKNKDKALIEKCTNEYEKLYTFYSKGLEMAKNLTPEDSYPANFSYARTRPVPSEFRREIKGASLFRCLAQYMNMLDKDGTKLEDVLEDPVKVTDASLRKYLANAPLTNMFKQDSIVDSLNSLFDLQSSIIDREETNDLDSRDLGLVFLSSVVHGPDAAQARACADLFGNGYVKTQVPSLFSTINDPNRVAKFIALEPQDRDAHLLNEDTVLYDEDFNLKTYDLETYINAGKTSPSSILLRINDIMDAHNGRGDKALNIDSPTDDSQMNWNIVNAAVDNIMTTFNEKNIPLSNTAKKVFDCMTAGRYGDITKTDKLILKNEAVIGMAVNGKSVKENINRTMNAYAELKQNYDSRNIFLKWFGPETRKLGAYVESVKDTILENGVTKETFDAKLDAALKNELKNEEKFTSNVKVTIDTKQERVPAQIQENELDSDMVAGIDDIGVNDSFELTEEQAEKFTESLKE